MDVHAKLRKQVGPKLEPGESIQQVFPALSGPSPYPFLRFLLLPYVYWMMVARYWVVAVTDRRIVVFRASFWAPSTVKDVAATLPRSARFGPVSGLWGAVEMGGTRYWVHKRFQQDLRAADADASSA